MKTRNNEKMGTDSILSVFIFLKTGCSTFGSSKHNSLITNTTLFKLLINVFLVNYNKLIINDINLRKENERSHF
jgi:hypothetical protein